MLLAAFGDVRGNAPALEAVLREIDAAGIQTIVNTGDSLPGYPYPDEVVDLLKRRRVTSIQGARDHDVALFTRRHRQRFANRPEAEQRLLERVHRATRSAHLEFIRGLHRRTMLGTDGLSICVCYGAPSSFAERLRPDDPEPKYQRQREYANVHVVVMGPGSEGAFARSVEDTLFVNPGSVGLRSEYAVIDTESDPWDVAFRTVTYDRKDLDRRIEQLDWPAPVA